ncbi:hypothetical protein EDB84DRAFT_1629053 [Lactarius hengduanensis]|nr:hypothetical protein EDB84DRAFT_1629053 [Lactarius hengduanensis]
MGNVHKKNPPSIWLTLNPADMQDPIAQVLCGQNIDLDALDAFDQRPSDGSIAADPFATASFFHLIVNAILEALLGIMNCNQNQPIKRETGILGDVDACVGTVEAQGRGTLHLHMVLWLKGSPPSHQMKEMLQTPEFRADVQSIPRETRVSFSRPVDPRMPQYDVLQKQAEERIARSVQVHQCSKACVRLLAGRFICKRRAPFALAVEDWIDANEAEKLFQKEESETFQHVFDDFVSSTFDETLATIANIEFYCECSEGARRHRERNGCVDSMNQMNHGGEDHFNRHMTEDRITNAIDRPFAWRELLHADTAITIGVDCGAFSDHEYHLACPQPAHHATAYEISALPQWQHALGFAGDNVTEDDITQPDIDESVMRLDDFNFPEVPVPTEPSVTWAETL